jgi:charged multivesicular body protein 7
MKSYESSTATLKTILSHPSLQRENIDKTMDALAEANADAREIDDAVRIGGDVALGVGENVDEADIESEWAELVKQMEADQTGRKLESESLKAPQGVNVEGKKTPESVALPSY